MISKNDFISKFGISIIYLFDIGSSVSYFPFTLRYPLAIINDHTFEGFCASSSKLKPGLILFINSFPSNKVFKSLKIDESAFARLSYIKSLLDVFTQYAPNSPAFI